MLVVQRAKKASVLIDDGINEMKIYVIDIYQHGEYGKMVKLGLQFPESYKIYREEMACAMKLGISLAEARQHIHQMRMKNEPNTEYTNHM